MRCYVDASPDRSVFAIQVAVENDQKAVVLKKFLEIFRKTGMINLLRIRMSQFGDSQEWGISILVEKSPDNYI